MSQLTQELKTLSQSFKSETEVAVELLKQAGLDEETATQEVLQMQMEKEAVEHLAMSGIDVESAVALVKAAGIDISEFKITAASEAKPEGELFTKVAEYIENLEAQVEALTKQASELEHQVATTASIQEPTYVEPELPEAFTKAASMGVLTKDDMAKLSTVDSELLTKIASGMEQPWEMGSPSGYARPKTDPLLEFCLS